MDHYLKTSNSYERLKNEYIKHGKIIIAVDFDDTIYDYHQKNRSYEKVINLLKSMKEHAYIIIYTAAGEERYPEIQEYCREVDIPYDSINENIIGLNIPEGKKLYYNILLDDRAGLGQAYDILLMLSYEIERRKIFDTIECSTGIWRIKGLDD